jgi:uncharacterized protein
VPTSLVPLRAVADLFVERQHLAHPRSEGLTAARLRRFAEDVGGIQLDSINVVARAHYLTVWSRFGPYETAALDDLVYRRRVLFEYWAHAACLVPISSLPWWRRAMLDYRVRHTGWSTWLRRNAKALARVRDAIAVNGPLAHAELGERRPAGAASGWWSWKPVQHALHYLWMTGALTVSARRHFHKRFDLFERAIPAVRGVEAVSAEEFAEWHVERSLAAMGAATEADLARYLTFPRFAPRVRRAALRALADRGRITEVAVEGSSVRWIARRTDVKRLARLGESEPPLRGTTLLAPFDSLLWHRDRAARLFAFDYRVEVYTPAAKRVHGYYSMPILHDGALVGRADLKAHRAERRLEARHVHFERWFATSQPNPADTRRHDRDRALVAVASALASLATFVGADAVTIGRVTPARLRAPLSKSIPP